MANPLHSLLLRELQEHEQYEKTSHCSYEISPDLRDVPKKPGVFSAWVHTGGAARVVILNVGPELGSLSLGLALPRLI